MLIVGGHKFFLALTQSPNNFLIDALLTEEFVQKLPAKLIISQKDIRILDIPRGQGKDRVAIC